MSQVRTLPQTLPRETAMPGTRHGLRRVLGAAAWQQLPAAVRERFTESVETVTYAGGYEVVRAALLGRLFGWLGLLVGMPVTPRTGTHVAARVVVRPGADGTHWDREYQWLDGTTHLVRSTKVVGEDGSLVERLPARLCMPLHTYVEGAVLHFVSLGYYFDLRFGDLGFGLRLWLPRFLTPGVTHVEHIDLGHGWFRFTMTVTHPLFGEMFFQTGRFCASEDAT